MKHFKKSRLLLLALLGIVLYSCSKEDDFNQNKDLSVFKENFKSIMSLYGENSDFKKQLGNIKNKRSSEESVISYISDNYGEEGIKALNNTIYKMNEVETDIMNYTPRIDALTNDGNLNFSDGKGIIRAIFDDNYSSKSSITSSKSLNDEIICKLEETSIAFYDNTLLIESYDREKYKNLMLKTYDEILDEIERNNSISYNEKESLIVSIQMSKENIDSIIPMENFENDSKSINSAKTAGWFKNLVKFIAKVVVAVVVTFTAVVVTAFIAIATGIGGVGGSSSASDAFQGAIIGGGVLIGYNSIMKGAFKTIDTW